MKALTRVAPLCWSLAAALLAGPFVVAPGPALAGTAQVTFVAPETYTDAATHRRAAKERARTLAALEQHIVRMAARLPANQTLKIEVTDIDRAGRYDMRTSPYEIRIMYTVTPPRITLRYTLSADGATLTSGEADLVDLAYLDRSSSVSSSDPLRYEKRLLSDWFRKTFTSPMAGG
jgi:hypothetical protein